MVEEEEEETGLAEARDKDKGCDGGRARRLQQRLDKRERGTEMEKREGKRRVTGMKEKVRRSDDYEPRWSPKVRGELKSRTCIASRLYSVHRTTELWRQTRARDGERDETRRERECPP